MDAVSAALRQLIVELVRQEVARALPSTPTTDYLPTAEAGKIAGVAQGTIRRWIREGRLRAHRAGRALRVSAQELQGLLEAPAKRAKASPELLSAMAFKNIYYGKTAKSAGKVRDAA